MTAALDRRCELCGAEPGTACVNTLHPNEPLPGRTHHLVRKVDQLPKIDVGPTTPLATRLRAAADAIAELNSTQGLPSERASVSPKYLFAAADEIDALVGSPENDQPT
jgi:hypothetical protein